MVASDTHPTERDAVLAKQRELLARCFHPTGGWTEFPRPETIPSLVGYFEEQAARYADRPAVSYAGCVLTYDQLNRAANRVAHALIEARSADPEPIPMLMHTSVDMIVALWGILKAGKFYVSLSPFDPPARRAQVLHDLGARVLITDAENHETALAVAGERHIFPIAALCDAGPDHNLKLEIAHDAYAYIIFTSSSTGQPKGVIVDRGDVLFFTRIAVNSFHLCPEERQGIIGALSFSGPAPQIYGGLLTGGCLCFYDLHRQSERAMAAWLRNERITYASSVPSVFRRLTQIVGPDERFPDLRLIGIGGDRLYREDLERIQAMMESDGIIRHHLGMSEVKYLTLGFWGREMRSDTPVVPVGHPVEDTEIRIVDEEGHEAPPGEIGEVWVKGRYMSPGYWRRPDLTARAYARDPANPDLRICHTGDLGMIRPDGALLLTGRADAQVKLGGQRVELSEIETALRAAEGVSEAAVVARQTGGSELIVHAYVVPATGARLSVAALRRQVAERVPAYMIPARIALLDALPLNNNGKTDRRALVPIGDERPPLEMPCVAPRTPVEASVAAIWREVLSLDTVGIYDRFLELGGQSLQATRIAGRILDAFLVDLPAGSLFNTPTVAEIAALIVQQQATLIDPVDVERLLAALEATDRTDDIRDIA